MTHQDGEIAARVTKHPSQRLGQRIAGRYLLERVLGQGGMGDVYVAVQEPLSRRVALKLIRADLMRDPLAAGRFEREARTLSALAHPNIVTLHDFGVTDEGEMFMAMELLQGESLRDRMRRVGPMNAADVLPILADVCRALEAAHRAGVVHRDLKPDNVMLVDENAVGAPGGVKVLDFGVAKLRDVDMQTPLTGRGHLIGTPGYIAPEMALEGVSDDPRSDLYAAGVMTWETLTGRALFSAPTPLMLVMKHAEEPPPRLSDVLSALATPPADVEELVRALLEKEPARRPQSARAVIDRITQLSLTAPSSTPPRTLPRVDPHADTQLGLQTPRPAAPESAAAPLATGVTVKASAPATERMTWPGVAVVAPPAPPSPPPLATSRRRSAGIAAAAVVTVAVAGGASWWLLRASAPATASVTVPGPVAAPAPDVVAPTALVAPPVAAPVAKAPEPPQPKPSPPEASRAPEAPEPPKPLKPIKRRPKPAQRSTTTGHEPDLSP